MKRLTTAILATLLLMSMLSACQGNVGNDKNKTPKLSGTVTISGDAKEDTQLTAAVSNSNAKDFTYQWYIDGEALPGAADDKLQLPVNAAGKAITVSVSAEGYAGELVSKAIEAVSNPQKIKTAAGLLGASNILGRVTTNKEDPTAVHLDWSASGYDFNVKAQGGKFRINYEVNYQCTLQVIVDGVLLERQTMTPNSDKGYYEFDIAAGEHNIKLIRQTPAEEDPDGCVLIKSVEFSGTVTPRPADKELYIEVIGDAYACGIGALGELRSEGYLITDHSATDSYGYLAAQALNAECSIVGMDAIGVLNESNDLNMAEAYELQFAWRDNRPYRFDRTPDVILLGLGASDTVGNGITEQMYKEALLKFVVRLREIHGEETIILWVGKNRSHYESMNDIIAQLSDDKLYAMQFNLGTDGAGPAGATSGQPSAENQKAFADAIVAYLKDTCGIAG